MEVNIRLLSGNLTFPSNEQLNQKPLLHDLVLRSSKAGRCNFKIRTFTGYWIYGGSFMPDPHEQNMNYGVLLEGFSETRRLKKFLP